jgi:hypothetical protein
VIVNGTPHTLPWSGSFLSFSEVSVQAVPAAGWEFDSWSGDAAGTDNPVTITMSEEKSATVSFNQLSYTLSLTGSGSGSVVVNGTPHELPWSGDFPSFSEITLQAIAADGWEFDSWSGDASGSANPDTITLSEAMAVTVNFSQLSYELALTGSGNGSVIVNGTPHALPWTGSFLSFSEVTVQAVGASEWLFSSWSGDASGSANPVTVEMDIPKNVTAVFVPVQYTLNLTSTGSGSVLVNGVVQTLPWSGDFDSGTNVTLTATAASGWQFSGWSGAIAWPTSPVIVTMNGDKTIAAAFDQSSYALTIAGVGSGSVLVNGETHALPYSGSFLSGTTVSLEAVAAENWLFSGWSGDVNWSHSELTVTMDEPITITATYSDLSRTLSIAQVGTGSVLVNGEAHTLPWSGSFLEGTEVSLEAVPATGWEFSAWSGDVSWAGEIVTLTMDRNKAVTATFTERSEFNLSLAKTGTGSVLLNGTAVALPWTGVLARGTSVTLEAVSGSDWQFDGWSGDLAGAANPVSFTMLDDYEASAAFSRIPYELALTSDGSGSVEVNGESHELPWTGEVYAGEEVTLEAVAASGWRFQNWSGDVAGSDNPVTITIAGDRSITAVFYEPSEFLLTIQKDGSGSVLINGVAPELPWTGAFPREAEVTLEAVASGVGGFEGWSGDLAGTDNPQTIVMDGDKTLTATFVCVETPFSDVACDYWAAEAIMAAKDAEIAYGYPDGTYRPNIKVDRGAMAVYVGRAMAGGGTALPEAPAEPTFPDVPADHWAYAAIEYAASQQVVQGYPDGSYHPAWSVTRGQMAVFIARSIAEPTGEAGLDGYAAPLAPTFEDVPTSLWCFAHVEYLVDHGIVQGFPDGTYRPETSVTRDQMAVYIARAYGILED